MIVEKASTHIDKDRVCYLVDKYLNALLDGWSFGRLFNNNVKETLEI